VSAIPNTIDKIVVMMGLVGPKVLDGPPVGLWPDEDCIIVGWQRDAGQPDVAGAGARVGHVEGFVSTDQETFTIACMVSVVSGDMTMGPLRDRVFGYYDAIAAAIRQDDTLLGSVARAQLSTASMAQYLYQEAGGVVEIAFDISCIANV
jgi:hypothetical protein